MSLWLMKIKWHHVLPRLAKLYGGKLSRLPNCLGGKLPTVDAKFLKKFFFSDTPCKMHRLQKIQLMPQLFMSCEFANLQPKLEIVILNGLVTSSRISKHSLNLDKFYILKDISIYAI